MGDTHWPSSRNSRRGRTAPAQLSESPESRAQTSWRCEPREKLKTRSTLFSFRCWSFASHLRSKGTVCRTRLSEEAVASSMPLLSAFISLVSCYYTLPFLPLAFCVLAVGLMLFDLVVLTSRSCLARALRCDYNKFNNLLYFTLINQLVSPNGA